RCFGDIDGVAISNRVSHLFGAPQAQDGKCRFWTNTLNCNQQLKQLFRGKGAEPKQLLRLFTHMVIGVIFCLIAKRCRFIVTKRHGYLIPHTADINDQTASKFFSNSPRNVRYHTSIMPYLRANSGLCPLTQRCSVTWLLIGRWWRWGFFLVPAVFFVAWCRFFFLILFGVSRFFLFAFFVFFFFFR